MSAPLRQSIKLYENRTVFKEDAFTGTKSEALYVTAGSRMLVTLHVLDIDIGAVVNVHVDNTYNDDLPYDTIQTLSLSATGNVKRVLSDFNSIFNFRLVVTGGMATVRLGIALYDNAGTTRIDNAQIGVDLDHATDSMGHFDSTRIGDGSDLLEINPDGSININDDLGIGEEPLWPYDEVSAVTAEIETTIITYTVPVGKVGLLYRVEASGENIAHYKVYINGTVIASKRTYFGGDLNATFEFTSTNKRSVQLESGDVLEVKVTHSRPIASNFESRLLLLEKATS